MTKTPSNVRCKTYMVTGYIYSDLPKKLRTKVRNSVVFSREKFRTTVRSFPYLLRKILPHLKKSSTPDSNQGPLVYQSSALPLDHLAFDGNMV